MMCALAPPVARVNLAGLIRDAEALPLSIEPPVAIPVVVSAIDPPPNPEMVVNFHPVVLPVASRTDPESRPVPDTGQAGLDTGAEYVPVGTQAPGPVQLVPRWLTTFLLTVCLILSIALGMYLLVRVINYRASTPSTPSNPLLACLRCAETARGA